VVERRELVIVARGDGTVNEVAHGVVNTDTVLALMPLGSIMNIARTPQCHDSGYFDHKISAIATS
jgi:diacylglycerol kinase family enzyme